MTHPYKVSYRPTAATYRYWYWVLAESSADAKAQHQGSAAGLSARKQTLSKCAFYKKFGKAATESHFEVKL